jgi:hypothetical protein
MTLVPERTNKLRFSTIILAAILGLVGFGLMGFIGGIAASFAAGPLHISPMEGARGYFAVTVAMIAGLLGFVGAVWIVLRRRGIRGARVVIGGITTFALLIASAASAVGIWYSMQPHVLNRNGPEPLLRLEVRARENVAPDSFAEVTGEMNTDRNGAGVVLDKASETDSRIRCGYVPLYYRTSQRLLAFKFPNGAARLFNVRLPANPMPRKYHEWSPWQNADFVDEPGSAGPKHADGETDLEIRYRIETADD